MVFRTDRKPVGLIFETFGPVKQPFYSIRFNSREDLEKLKLEPGDSLFFSPDFSEMVKIDKLLKQKGCDASWEDDKECPDKFLVSIYWGLKIFGQKEIFCVLSGAGYLTAYEATRF